MSAGEQGKVPDHGKQVVICYCWIRISLGRVRDISAITIAIAIASANANANVASLLRHVHRKRPQHNVLALH